MARQVDNSVQIVTEYSNGTLIAYRPKDEPEFQWVVLTNPVFDFVHLDYKLATVDLIEEHTKGIVKDRDRLIDGIKDFLEKTGWEEYSPRVVSVYMYREISGMDGISMGVEQFRKLARLIECYYD